MQLASCDSDAPLLLPPPQCGLCSLYLWEGQCACQESAVLPCHIRVYCSADEAQMDFIYSSIAGEQALVRVHLSLGAVWKVAFIGSMH